MKISRHHDLVLHRGLFRKPVDFVRRLLDLPVRAERQRTVVEELRPFDIRRRAAVPAPVPQPQQQAVPPGVNLPEPQQAARMDLPWAVDLPPDLLQPRGNESAQELADSTITAAMSNLSKEAQKIRDAMDRVDQALKTPKEIPAAPLVQQVVFNTRMKVHDVRADVPSADSRLLDFVDAENSKACTRDKSGSLDPSTLDLAAVPDEVMQGIAEEIRLSGLMHVTHGSKPMFLMEAGHPLVSVIQQLQEQHILKEGIAVVGSAQGDAYLVNRHNLKETIEMHGAELRQAFGRALDVQARQPGSASGVAAAKQRLDGRIKTTADMMGFALTALRTGVGLSHEVLGILLGYGPENARRYELRSQGGDEGRRHQASQQEAISTAVIDEINASLAGPQATLPKPPSFLTWDDEPGPGKPQTSALLTQYLNESMDMAEGPLKRAYESPEAFIREAPRVFLASLFMRE